MKGQQFPCPLPLYHDGDVHLGCTDLAVSLSRGERMWGWMVERLVHVFVASCLDYCIVLLSGLPMSSIKSLQLVQNTGPVNLPLTLAATLSPGT